MVTGALLLIAWSVPVQAQPEPQEPTRLREVIVTDSATEALQFDPIVPEQTETPTQASGTGSLHRDFADRLPLPVTDSGTPGGFSQFRGFGRTADETNVQTLGIPLNQALGGGLDLSSLPQFLWSTYRFQAGPTQGAYDPRATSGTLSLEPWTAAAIRSDQYRMRLSQLISADLSQTAVGGTTGRFAGLVGWSHDFTRGLSGSASARIAGAKDVSTSAGFDARLHVLATDLKSRSPGPSIFPTPDDFQLYQRVIPVLELGRHSSPRSQQKLTLYYDSSRGLHEGSYRTDDRSTQFGFESALRLQNWRVGLSGRQVRFRREGGLATQPENYFHGSVARLFETGSWILEPVVQLDSVTDRGLAPGGGIGLRRELSSRSSLFSRLSYAPRFPSVQDRFYPLLPPMGPIKGFQGNPDLRAEKGIHLTAGHETRSRHLESLVQLYTQLKDDLHLRGASGSPNIETIVNAGSAVIAVAQHELSWRLAEFFSFSNALSLSYSQINPSGDPVAYLAPVTDVVRLEAHSADREKWGLGLIWRGVSDARDQNGDPFAGYGLLTLDGRYRVTDLSAYLGGGVLDLVLRVENLTDRRVEVTRYYPLSGTIGSVLLVGSL